MLDDMECSVLTEFGAGEGERWFTVNDNVMGGRSRGGPTVSEGALVFSGSINTNGGGFSSVRRSLEPGALSGATALVLTLQGDGRAYALTFQTSARYRGRQVAFQAPLTSASHDSPTEVMVDLDSLQPKIFGRRVTGPVFEAADASTVGIILNDGRDGPFSLRVEKISACRPLTRGA